jgi:hypothetical protein
VCPETGGVLSKQSARPRTSWNLSGTRFHLYFLSERPRIETGPFLEIYGQTKQVETARRECGSPLTSRDAPGTRRGDDWVPVHDIIPEQPGQLFVFDPCSISGFEMAVHDSTCQGFTFLGKCSFAQIHKEKTKSEVEHPSFLSYTHAPPLAVPSGGLFVINHLSSIIWKVRLLPYT